MGMRLNFAINEQCSRTGSRPYPLRCSPASRSRSQPAVRTRAPPVPSGPEAQRQPVAPAPKAAGALAQAAARAAWSAAGAPSAAQGPAERRAAPQRAAQAVPPTQALQACSAVAEQQEQAQALAEIVRAVPAQAERAVELREIRALAVQRGVSREPRGAVELAGTRVRAEKRAPEELAEKWAAEVRREATAGATQARAAQVRFNPARRADPAKSCRSAIRSRRATT